MKRFLTSISFVLVILSAISLTGCQKEDISKMPEVALANKSGDNYVYLFDSDKQVSETSDGRMKLAPPFIRIGFPADLDWGTVLGDWKIVNGTPSTGGKREVDVYDTVEGWIKGGTVSLTSSSLSIDGKTKKGARYLVSHSGLIPFLNVEE